MGLYLMDREEGVNIYKMDAKKRINSLSKIDKILKVSQTRSPLLIRACILQQACYSVVSVSIHHWFTVGCYSVVSVLQHTPLVYSRLGYNMVSVSVHHWFTVGLVTTWFLFLYTTGLQ